MSKLTASAYLLLIVFLVVAVGSNSSASGQQSDSALTVSLKTNRLKYQVGEKVKLDVALLNSGEAPIYLYGYLSWGYSSCLTLHVRSGVGQEVPAKELDDSISPSPPRGDQSVFVRLNPQHFFGTSRITSLDELNINRPGRYRIRVDYHSPIPDSNSQGLAIWSKEKGRVESNPIQIEVVSR